MPRSMTASPCRLGISGYNFTVIIIDRGSAEPAAIQVSTQIISLIRQGAFLPGDPLPSIREVAEAAGLSTATVTQAFSLLASTGWIETRVRRRAMVAHRLPAVGDPLSGAEVVPSEGGGTLDRTRLAEAAHLLGLDVDLVGDGPRQVPCNSVVRARRRRRATLRQRRWLGQRLRGVVRMALSCGMTSDELQALLLSAIAWERVFTFAGGGGAAGERDADDRREVEHGTSGGKTPPIPPFLIKKLRQRGVLP